MAAELIRDAGFARQRNLNERTANCWGDYASHRAQIMGRLLKLADHTARLLVLGAGNCNDLDLPALTSAFAQVTLLDWDTAALERGVSQQLPGAASSCRLLGGVEITGFLPLLHAASAAARPGLIARFLNGEFAPSLPGAGSYDVVASCCLLSQLIDSASSATPPAQLPAVAARLRQQHLATVKGLLAQRGVGLIITDFVSSDTAPVLLQAGSAANLPLLAQQLLLAGNFFSGLHPGQLAQDLAAISSHPEGAAISDPWLWNVGNRRFLVIAASFAGPKG
jgi:hypothetical protein